MFPLPPVLVVLLTTTSISSLLTPTLTLKPYPNPHLIILVYTKENGVLSTKLTTNDDEFLLRWVSGSHLPVVHTYHYHRR